jgi:hydrogenase maturation protease
VSPTPAVVCGVGSPILGDDGVGLHVVRALREQGVPDGVTLCELGTGGLAMADVALGCQRLVIVDAIETGAPAGTIHLLEGDDVARGTHLGRGHEPSVPEALAMSAKLLGEQMPAQVWVVAIEAEQLLEFSEQLTPAVAAAVPGACARVLSLLGLGGPTTPSTRPA